MYTYLALGDSYTIGEHVPLNKCFPYQTADLLRKKKIEVAEPVIIAKTGWTTGELVQAVQEKGLSELFSFVSLLIGVNNQYRGQDLAVYKREFEQLLHHAIDYAGGQPERVFVLSIPDWGVTPFAEGRDKDQIAAEINVYNAANNYITQQLGAHYLPITDSTRNNGTKPGFLAEDGLHPSAKEYTLWAEGLASEIEEALKK